MKITKKDLKLIYAVVFLFLAIYQPPIFFINVIHFLLLISMVGIIKNKNILCEYISKYQIIMYLILFINFIINGVVFLINKGSNFVYSQFVMCIEIQIVIFYLFLFIKENKISIKEVTIDTALFQSAISIVSFVVPSVQEGIINICIKN